MTATNVARGDVDRNDSMMHDKMPTERATENTGSEQESISTIQRYALGTH